MQVGLYYGSQYKSKTKTNPNRSVIAVKHRTRTSSLSKVIFTPPQPPKSSFSNDRSNRPLNNSFRHLNRVVFIATYQNSFLMDHQPSNQFKKDHNHAQSVEDIMSLRGRFDQVYFRKRRNAVLWLQIGFVLSLFSVVGVLL